MRENVLHASASHFPPLCWQACYVDKCIEQSTEMVSVGLPFFNISKHCDYELFYMLTLLSSVRAGKCCS